MGKYFLVLLVISGLFYSAVVKADAKPSPSQLLQKCNSGNQKACSSLAQIYLDRQGIHQDLKKDYSKVKALFSKACDTGDEFGCYVLGVMYYKGDRVKRDYAKAKTLLSKSCYSSPLGCELLGDMYLNGVGVKQDAMTAKALYRKSCDSGNMSDCFALGDVYYFGLAGVKQDYTKSKELYSKACKGGYAKACSILGSMYLPRGSS